ncbi:MAG: endonuclease MutS2 [Bacillota bacterium]
MEFDIEILEFDKIRNHVSGKAKTEGGKNFAKSLRPFSDKAFIEKHLKETDEASVYLRHNHEPSFGGIHPIKDAIKRASIGGTLDDTSLLDILNHIETAVKIKRTMLTFEETIEEDFSITAYAENIEPLTDLKKTIQNVYDSDGSMKDSASDKLRAIRQSLNTTKKRIKKTLDDLVRQKKSHLSEQLITLRYDRYVLPVKASDKNAVKGTALDYSSSGETIYIEPESVRDQGAKKAQLEADEKKEMEAIRTWLSGIVATDYEPLKYNDENITWLDFVFAKALYAYQSESYLPTIGDSIHLIKARHPLIDKSEVVANTITFDEGDKMMIITGSNTGGKTVTLKTVGLLQIMGQSGLLIPALEGSVIKPFKSIRADIGDEQSIEQSLSTFSSHMKRVANILKNYDDNQLVLLDEVGSGTDPREGSALAMSILTALLEKDSRVVATTHYPELKAFAYTKDLVMNASVEFDETTLKPTYRLLLRTPGESHAFLISRRLGLPENIVKNAENDVYTSKSEVSDLIDKLKQESKKVDRELKRYEDLNETLTKEKTDIISLKETLQSEKERLREEVRRENAKEMKRMKDKARGLIEELEMMKETSFKPHELAEKKHDVKSLNTETEEKAKAPDRPLQKGDTVRVLKYNRPGELVEQQKNGWLVNMGTLKSVFPEEALELIKKKPESKEKKPAPSGTTIRKTVSKSLDLRGMRVEEARDALEKYLDDIAISNQPYATIIHGFGTMALRKMVKDYVKKHPLVKRHRDGEAGEGGQGATVVYFD